MVLLAFLFICFSVFSEVSSGSAGKSLSSQKNQKNFTGDPIIYETKRVNALKDAFEKDTWYDFSYGIKSFFVRKWCRSAYEEYLKHLVVRRQLDRCKASKSTVEKRLAKLDEKCKLCILAIDLFDEDDSFMREKGYKFVIKGSYRK
ncbi:MAG: hypothetical protein H6845_02345 [Alphaproteobacteria bacterium]|nr:MAG: hypothetical protein H6845_02345 [Alphaproteobacteria bacterium]